MAIPSFKKYIQEVKREENLSKLLRLPNEIHVIDKNGSENALALEHLTYKNIPGTSSSYRQDQGNTNTKTLKHAHVYAKRNGGGKELYSVNVDGSGHDGSSGITIPPQHADFFRKMGYSIPLSNALESLDINTSFEESFSPIFLLLESDIIESE